MARKPKSVTENESTEVVQKNKTFDIINDLLKQLSELIPQIEYENNVVDNKIDYVGLCTIEDHVLRNSKFRSYINETNVKQYINIIHTLQYHDTDNLNLIELNKLLNIHYKLNSMINSIRKLDTELIQSKNRIENDMSIFIEAVVSNIELQ